ncbi:DUF3813 domain-containing protein [Bacillus sp. REN10]|uniref:DUF3813 domain-containing protein n=1 Tax=Bacillus sp. REN10 TaxID=2782541 RepID=UPI00193BF63D|nr:DUF3813 domain-containing protein [Bacillus sp. REN10]
MGQKLFREARRFVHQALTDSTEENIATAKNSLVSAFANSTLAQQEQLSQMQENLRQVEHDSHQTM